LAVDIAGGRAVVAPGSYRIVGLVARERDASGIEWEAACDSRGDIDAQAGAEIAVTAGPPLFSAIHASPVGHGLIALEFELTDSSGGECQLLRAGRRPEPPGFEVQNAAGEIVAAGRFEYG